MMHEGNFFLLAPTSGPPTIMGPPPHCGVCGGGSYATGQAQFDSIRLTLLIYWLLAIIRHSWLFFYVGLPVGLLLSLKLLS